MTLDELAQAARPLNDEDRGSERQIAAEKAFFRAAGFLGHEFTHLATTEEMIDEALRRVRPATPGSGIPSWVRNPG